MYSDLYGFEAQEIDQIAEQLSKALGIAFGLHESSYRGGDYYRHGMPGEEELILQRNWDTVENEPIETTFANYPVLLYVGPTARSGELQALVTRAFRGTVTLLRHSLV
jgi:hypothetical protein